MFSLRFLRNLNGLRNFSTKYKTKWNVIEPVQHLLSDGNVLISSSNNIFDNLAIEDWIYENYDFSQNNERILLLWHNDPAVVIGRHQNVWREVNCRFCEENSVTIARRNSGGGTVYHDLENLNISFLTSRKNYDRKRNLRFISDVLKQSFGIETEINSREDLIVSESGEKVSGTASKLNAFNSYHHCTLLVDVDRNRLRNSLRREDVPDFVSRATKSVPSPVLNLKSLNPEMNIQNITLELSQKYSNFLEKTSPEPSITKLDPKMFQNLSQNRSKFLEWSWIYGKTPEFKINQKFYLNGEKNFLTMIIEKGKIKQIEFVNDFNEDFINELNAKLTDLPFKYKDFNRKITELNETSLPEEYNGDKKEALDTIKIALMNCYDKCNL